jgi:hypothetical protein
MGFVVVARQLPQPWRGILDAGVVTGLSLGIMSILYFLLNSLRTPGFITVSPEVPLPVTIESDTAALPDA